MPNSLVFTFYPGGNSIHRLLLGIDVPVPMYRTASAFRWWVPTIYQFNFDGFGITQGFNKTVYIFWICVVALIFTMVWNIDWNSDFFKSKLNILTSDLSEPSMLADNTNPLMRLSSSRSVAATADCVPLEVPISQTGCPNFCSTIHWCAWHQSLCPRLTLRCVVLCERFGQWYPSSLFAVCDWMNSTAGRAQIKNPPHLAMGVGKTSC